MSSRYVQADPLQPCDAEARTGSRVLCQQNRRSRFDERNLLGLVPPPWVVNGLKVPLHRSTGNQIVQHDNINYAESCMSSTNNKTNIN